MNPFAWIGNLFRRRKSMPAAAAGGNWSGTQFVDKYKSQREPTANELMAELKGIAWACASINAATCASYAPQLYVTTHDGQAAPKCARRAVAGKTLDRLRHDERIPPRIRKAAVIEEVQNHPLLDVLFTPNAYMSSYDLWEVTQLYLETQGRAFWQVETDDFDRPVAIWPLPAQNMKALRKSKDSPNPYDLWEYSTGRDKQYFTVEEIVYFRFPDPREPYTGGMGPLRAAFEQVNMISSYNAMKQSTFDNRALPDAIVSPAEVIGEEERDRLETQWNSKFRRGGAGRILVAESALNVDQIKASWGDLAALAELNGSKQDVCNAFHVPISFFTTNTNLANIQAGNVQHAQQCITPRLTRRDEALNSKLVPMFDPTGRLWLSSENPVPNDSEAVLQQVQLDLVQGVISINEYRAGRGLPPVPWGDLPWLPLKSAQTDVPRSMPGAGEGDES